MIARQFANSGVKANTGIILFNLCYFDAHKYIDALLPYPIEQGTHHFSGIDLCFSTVEYHVFEALELKTADFFMGE